MQPAKRAINAVKTAWSSRKGILAIALAFVPLTIGFLRWTTQYVPLLPDSVLYDDLRVELQLVMALIPSFFLAIAIYFLAGKRFGATIVTAFFGMYVIMAFPILIESAEEKLGWWRLLGLVLSPPLAAVATKAANIASRKRGYMGIRKKFADSFYEALRRENCAELCLWAIAWAAGGFGIFLLSKAIEMW